MEDILALIDSQRAELVLTFVPGIVGSALLILLASGAVGIRDATVGRVLVLALVMTTLAWAVNIFLAYGALSEPLVPWGIAAAALAIGAMGVFHTSFEKALAVVAVGFGFQYLLQAYVVTGVLPLP